MKTISIVIPTYNEEENIPLIYKEIVRIFKEILNNYQYEMLFIDNYSKDRSREILQTLCQQDRQVKAIFNAKNFGFNRSTFYGLMQGTGDCTVLIFADMQDPPAMIVEFVKYWEEGYKIVAGIKNRSRENPLMFLLRKIYYRLVKAISEIDHIEQFDGFGLYDKSFIGVLKQLHDPMPYLRGIVAELGFERKDVYYRQERRKYGKTNFNFFRLYDVAMLGITSYSKVVMRLATITGFAMAVICFLIGCYTFIVKLTNWETFQVGLAAVSVGIFFLGAVLLFFIGFLGEYILNINIRVMDRPLVIEERRINFSNDVEANTSEAQNKTERSKAVGQ